MMGVLRRLKVQEMAKFKYLINFGVELDTMDYLRNKILPGPMSEMGRRMSKIGSE